MIAAIPNQSPDLGKTTHVAAHLVTADTREGKRANQQRSHANIAQKTARRHCREFRNDADPGG